MRQLERLERLVAHLGAGRDDFLGQCSRVESWRRLFDLAFEHGVAGVLDHRLAAAGFAVPAAARDRVGERLAVDRLWHRRTASDLRRILGVFAELGVRAVVLKGLVLGERLYPRATQRPAGDLDLLVDASDVPRAKDALASVGFGPRVWKPHQTPPTHALVMERSSGGTVDLHHRASHGFATTLEAGGMIERSIRYRTEGGDDAWILSPEDELLYLAVHAARHRFVRLGWLVDLRLFIERHPDLRWDVAGSRAGALRVRRAAAVALAVLEKRLRFGLPAPARSALAPDFRTRAAMRLADAANGRRFNTRARRDWERYCLVIYKHTFQALLGSGTGASLGYWVRSMTRSAGKMRRA